MCLVLIAAVLAGCSSSAPTDAAPPATVAEEDTGWRVLEPGPLAPREGAATVWTGEELVVFGGRGADDGAAYDPEAREWRRLSPGPLPEGYAVGVWTDSEVLLWSLGADLQGPVRWRGAAWNPSTDAWRILPPSRTAAPVDNIPEPVWTGAEMIDVSLNAAFDPGPNTWRPLPPRPFEGHVAATAWTGEELVALIGYGGGAIAYDPERDRWSELPTAPLNGTSVELVWDGERLVAVDYELAAAWLRPGDARWHPISGPALRFYECGPSMAVAVQRPVLVHCSGHATLTDAGWAIGPSHAEPWGELVSAGDGAFSWWSSDEAFNFEDAPVTYLSEWRPPTEPSGDLALERTIPVGTVLLDLPSGTKLTDTDRVEEAGGLVTRLHVDLDDPDCRLVSTHGAAANAQGIRNDVSEVDADLGEIDLPWSDGSPHTALVARVEAGQLDEQAHVLVAESTSDVLDITCPDLATAEELLARIHR